jgi:hypothetical protein
VQSHRLSNVLEEFVIVLSLREDRLRAPSGAPVFSVEVGFYLDDHDHLPNNPNKGL